jgi:hypothetical protein
MPSRFQEHSARSVSPLTLPPIGPDGVQRYLEQGGGQRTRAVRTGPRSIGPPLARALRAMLEAVRGSAYGIAKRAPDRLTSPCR